MRSGPTDAVRSTAGSPSGFIFPKKKPAMHRPYLQATGTGCVFFPTSGGRQPTNFLDGLGR
jgi:hypothetical protein